MSHTIEQHNAQVKHVYNQYYGGYSMYWKLYAQLCKQMKPAFRLMGKAPFKKAYLVVLFGLIQSPYWLFIKPLGSMFNVTRKFNGTYQIVNNVLTESTVKKVVIFNIVLFKNVKVPVVGYSGKPSTNDWKNYLLKDKPDVFIKTM